MYAKKRRWREVTGTAAHVEIFRAWGAVRRDIAQLDGMIAECQKTLEQIEKALALSLAYGAAPVADYSGMPRSQSEDTPVERQVLRGEEVRARLICTRLMWTETQQRLVADRAELMTPEYLRINAYIESLPEMDRRIMEMRYIEGRSLDEIAEDMHLGRTTVYDRIRTISEQIPNNNPAKL